MSEVTYRGNLSASSFPLVSTYQGRSVIVGGPDQSYLRGYQVPDGGLINENDRGIPQILYGHNVIPSSEGLQSVTFSQLIGAIGGGAVADEIYPVYSPDIFGVTINSGVFICVCNNVNAVYRLSFPAGVPTWTAVIVAGANDIYTKKTTTAVVNGQSYFYFQGAANPYRLYDITSNTLALVVPTGVPISNVEGICAAFGYLVIWNGATVAWSSTVTPTDFTPSLITGAGSQRIQDARGKIVFCYPHELGFILMCRENCVGAVYSGNSRFPFVFKEISDAGGYIEPNLQAPHGLAASDQTADQYYVYTTTGMQDMNIKRAQTILTDVTDFLSGNLFEDFNTTTRVMTQTTITTPKMVKRLALIADRYLIISYGLTSYTHALVYDVQTKRLGKIKLAHVLCFEIKQQPNNGIINSPLPRNAIAFLTSTGAVQLVNFASALTASPDSCLIVGKFQYSRQRMIQLQHIDLENVQTAATCDLYVWTSLNGKTPATVAIAATLDVTTANLRTWRFHQTGINHTLIFIGAFYGSSLVLKFNTAGRR